MSLINSNAVNTEGLAHLPGIPILLSFWNFERVLWKAFRFGEAATDPANAFDIVAVGTITTVGTKVLECFSIGQLPAKGIKGFAWTVLFLNRVRLVFEQTKQLSESWARLKREVEDLYYSMDSFKFDSITKPQAQRIGLIALECFFHFWNCVNRIADVREAFHYKKVEKESLFLISHNYNQIAKEIPTALDDWERKKNGITTILQFIGFRDSFINNTTAGIHLVLTSAKKGNECLETARTITSTLLKKLPPFSQ